MKISTKQYAISLHQALEETDAKGHDTVIDNLIKVMKDNNQLDLYEEVVKEYELHTEKLAGVRQVEVTTATDFADKELIDSLNVLAGEQIKVTKKVDSEIIGGVVIKVDDTLIDGSIKTSLENLQNNLKE